MIAGRLVSCQLLIGSALVYTKDFFKKEVSSTKFLLTPFCGGPFHSSL